MTDSSGSPWFESFVYRFEPPANWSKLLVTPEQISLGRSLLAGPASRTLSEVSLVRRGLFGGLHIETDKPNDLGLRFTAIGNNRQIFEAFERFGYPVRDDFPALIRWRKPLLVALLTVDAVVLLGLVVAGDAWPVAVGFPLMFILTILWGLPRVA